MADGGNLEFQDVCYTNHSKFTFNELLDPEIYDYNFKSSSITYINLDININRIYGNGRWRPS